MDTRLLLEWWNLVFIAPLALALLYLGFYVLTGIGADGGHTFFFGTDATHFSTAGSATITNNPGTVSGATGGVTEFDNASTAGSSSRSSRAGPTGRRRPTRSRAEIRPANAGSGTGSCQIISQGKFQSRSRNHRCNLESGKKRSRRCQSRHGSGRGRVKTSVLFTASVIVSVLLLSQQILLSDAAWHEDPA